MSTEIRIRNNTHWATRDLRRFVAKVAKREGMKTVRVTFVYNRQVYDRCSGYAWYHTDRSVIRIPSERVDKRSLALVLAHEFGHNQGLKHKDMRGDSRYQWVGNWRERYAWAEELALEKSQPKRKPRKTANDKLAHALKMVAAWKTKAKRTETMLKKWERKVRYYEKQAA